MNISYKSSAAISETSGKQVTWSSSAPNTVSVDASSGKLTALKKGTAVITASAPGCESANCTVTVFYTWWQQLIRIILFGWIWY